MHFVASYTTAPVISSLVRAPMMQAESQAVHDGLHCLSKQQMYRQVEKRRNAVKGLKYSQKPQGKEGVDRKTGQWYLNRC